MALVFLAFGCENTPRGAEAEATSLTPQVSQTPSSNVAAGAAASALTRVTDPSLVCMVNNQFMGRPQIPIEVGGRTYFGCCEMCKGRLANDPSSRVATDPVSERSVDKAIAVIGKMQDGRTLYFESDQTFAAYARRTTP